MAILDAVFADRPGMTPQDVERKRRLAEQLLKGSDKPITHWTQGLNMLAEGLIGGIQRRRADEGEKAGQAKIREVLGSILTGGAPTTPAASPTAGGTPSPLPATVAGAQMGATSPAPSSAPASTPEVAELESYIRDAATKRNIDPDIAVRVARSEGLGPGVWQSNYVKNGRRETSYGPFQLLVGGGLGDKFQKIYGKSPADPSTVRQQVDFALDEAATGGWSPWYGAAKVGVGSRTGLDNARALGYNPSTQNETASLDPSVGMAPGAAAIETQAPTPYRDPMIVQSPAATALAAQEMQASTAPNRQPMGPQLPPPVNVSTPVVPPQNAQLAQALTGGQATQPAPGISPQVIQQLLGDPWTADMGEKLLGNYLDNQSRMAFQRQQAAQEEQQWRARKEWERQAQQSDPAAQLDMRYKQAQLDALTGKKQKNWQKLSDTMLFDPESGETKSIEGAPAGGFRFSGSSVEAQALNGLIESGQLTPEQAQQLGAGKTVSGPNGELLFLTPQGVFSQQGNRSPQPVSGNASAGEIDIFGGQAPLQASPAPAPQPTTPATQPQPGIIPLTEPKVTVDERKAAGFSDRMAEAEKALGEFGSAGSNVFDNFVRGNDWIPDAAENWMVSKDFQQYDQARRNFVNAVLRRESGAVISPEEFENANKQYFPQPGDTADVIEQKRQNRQTVMDAMKRDAGPTYGSGVNGGWQDVDGVKIRRK